MDRKISFLEKTIRVVLVFIFVFSAAAPTPAVAKSWFPQEQKAEGQ